MPESAPTVEATRQPEILHLEPNVIERAANGVKDMPDIYASEWRFIAGNEKGALENPLTRFIASKVGLEGGSVYLPDTGKTEDYDYVKGALIMHRILYWQADQSQLHLPLITQNTIDQHKKNQESGQIGNPPPEWELFRKEFRKLSDGVVNPKFIEGAADIYNIVKLALENPEKDTTYDHNYGPTFYQSDEKSTQKIEDYKREHAGEYKTAEEIAQILREQPHPEAGSTQPLQAVDEGQSVSDVEQEIAHISRTISKDETSARHAARHRRPRTLRSEGGRTSHDHRDGSHPKPAPRHAAGTPHRARHAVNSTQNK